MKTIITSSGQVGKFSDYQILDDRYLCDGVEYPFAALGETHSIGDYVEPALTTEQLNAIRAQKWEEIKAYREYLKEEGGIPYDGHWYHSDPTSKGEFTLLSVRALAHRLSGGNMSDIVPTEQGENLQIKTKSNGFVSPTYADIENIASAAKDQVEKLHKAAETHHYFLNVSSDPANYNWRVGYWPTVYSGA